jgi:hypothetical protein
MGENISYDYVWNLFQKEKQTNQLLQLSRTFYVDILDYLSGASLNEQQKANMEKLLVNLFEKRKQKIFLYLAYNKPLPQPLDNSETEFYNDLLKTANSYRIDPNKKIKSNILLRSITDIPEIVLPSGKRIGPLKKNEVLDVQDSAADVTYLINNAICESYNR